MIETNEPYESPFNAARLLASYESYFTKKRWSTYTDADISVHPAYEGQEFFHLANELNKSFQRTAFSFLMKQEWIDRNIRIKDRRIIDSAYSVFIGQLKWTYDTKIGFSRIAWKNSFCQSIRSYCEELFPGFNDLDGFKYDFQYPFEFITLEGLFMVAYMPERMRLVMEGERRKMSMIEFADYVAAYVTETFLTTGKDYKIYYRSSFYNWSPPYVNERLTFSQKLQNKIAKDSIRAAKREIKIPKKRGRPKSETI